MSDLTPDHVAQLASRIYGETPGGHGPSGLAEAPGVPVDPAADSMLREQVQAPSFPVPNDGVPASSAPVLAYAPVSSVQTPSPAVAEAAPAEAFTFPMELRAFSGQLPASPGPESQTDGLRAFVQNIRRSDFRSSTEAFPGEKPSSSAYTNQVPAPSQTTRPGSGDHTVYPRDDRTNGYSARPLDVAAVRQDFPILHQRVHGRPLVWLDNAATTQKPQSVIDTLSNFYERDNSNIHRGAHTLAARATDAFEQARDKVRDFLGASSSKEIVFVRGTTEAINLVAQTWGRKFLQPGDEIILSTLEHHANIVPWQMISKETGARLRVIPVNDRGEIILEDYQSLLGPRTKLVALAHASNSLGTLLPVAEMTQMAKRYGARVLIDGAQTVAHLPVNVQTLGSDFYVFSGHKIFGPTGIGVLHAREELLEIMPPWQGGGSMIKNVTFEETTYSDPPAKFEAGTPNIADAVGLGAALDYVSQFGLPNIANYEHELLGYATEQLSRINGLRLIGTAREKVGVISFVLKDRKTEEVGRMLDLEGIAVRAGHHCSQPSLRRFGVESTVRPSLAFYNTVEEIDRLADAIRRIQRR
jgi:cysteine desulfurase / selenocysteine lyase